MPRIPPKLTSEAEQRIVGDTLKNLNKKSDKLENSLNIKEMFVLHSDEQLQVKERLRIGSQEDSEESILRSDYLRLFAHLVSTEVLKSHLELLMTHVRSKLYDDPDDAQKTLEFLAQNLSHPLILKELLKLYRVRNIRGDAVLRIAQRYSDISPHPDYESLLNIIKDNFEEIEPYYYSDRNKRDIPLTFIEKVWHKSGSNDIELGIKLAKSYENNNKNKHAADILLELVKKTKSDKSTIIYCIRMLRESKRFDEAKLLIKNWHDRLLKEEDFITEWAKLALHLPETSIPNDLLEPPLVNLIPIGIAMKLLYKLGKQDESDKLFKNFLQSFHSHQRSPRELYEFSMEYPEIISASGYYKEIENTLRSMLPEEEFERMFRRIKMRY